jgi:CheY-like chemotaxis protein
MNTDAISRLRHRLRTPLNHIIGYAEMVRDEARERGATADAGRMEDISLTARQVVEAVRLALPPYNSVSETSMQELRDGISGLLDRITVSMKAVAPLTQKAFAGDLERIRSASQDLLSFAQKGELPEVPGESLHSPVENGKGVGPLPGRILIVDDDLENREILRRRLEREGFYAADEPGGAAAIARLRREKFDLVLLDLFMPGMDGFEVLAVLKADPNLRGFPVVVLSALDDQETAVRSIESGAEDFLSKPVDPVILRTRLGAILRRSRAEAERAELEEQLMQGAKLESLGVLAGGLAHDFNNILTGIMGNASLVMESFPENDGNRALLEEVVNASERAADLTRQMLAFAGKGQFVIEPVDLSKTLDDITDLIQSSLPKQAKLLLQLSRDLPTVDADPGQIQQMVLNLVINAGEAIGDQGGSVVVETGVREIPAGLPADPPFDALPPGLYAFAAVRDTGAGMEPAVRARIFDPFFSTKFTGRGLGLAAAMGIVRTHRGVIRVESETGQGSRFEVLLPARATAAAREPARTAPRTSRTVLVVDDEEIVRRTTKAVLERKGFQVIMAENGEEAVRLFREQSDAIALILLDLTMPVMGGEEAARYLHTIRHDVPILVSSGYNESEVARRFAGRRVAGYVRKPYTASALLSKIGAALGMEDAAGAGS